jgi:hypothetical protein
VRAVDSGDTHYAFDLELEHRGEARGIGERADRTRGFGIDAKELRGADRADFGFNRAAAAVGTGIVITARPGNVDDEGLPAVITDVQPYTRAAIAQVTVLGVEVDDTKNFDVARCFAQCGGQRCGDELFELVPGLYIEAQRAYCAIVV